VPEDWPVLNTTKGYSLAYSLDWEICQNTIYSWTFCDSQKDLAGIGHQLRLYVSVFPNDYPNSDWEVYNFIPTDTIRAFMALPVGESMQKVPGSPRPAYNTYKRLPDQMVAGWNAPVIENSNVWGLPAGTTDRIVFIVTHETTYMLGMYYESLEQLTMFEQVLDSFQFAP
jgi:hypothetical protein